MAKVVFPQNLLKPILHFFHLEEKKLNQRKKDLEAQDPFKDEERANDNAAIDTDAAEQFGHATVEGLKRELEKRLIQIRKASTRIKIGKYGICEKCGQMIDTDRLMVFPEATNCIKCEKKKEKR